MRGRSSSLLHPAPSFPRKRDAGASPGFGLRVRDGQGGAA